MLERLSEIFRNRTLNYYEDRIMAQLKYGYILSAKKDGVYDGVLKNAEDILVGGYNENGAITKDLVFKAEAVMEPLKTDAKEFDVICVSHAHIDMNWQWGWDETVGVTLDTFRTMLNIMKEYPDFKFSQSQGSVYKILEDYDKEMLEEVKERVREGRWEVTATTWVEADKNMPSGESHARHILYTKEYLSKLFNKDLSEFNIDFEPDTFGHSLNTPELLSQGGVKYYYHCRGRNEGANLYRWTSPSGAEVIVYWEPHFYNGLIDSNLALSIPDIAEKCNMNTVLKVYGVGDHGGGPTRRDLERIIDMMQWPIYPKLRFGTYNDYFSIVEKEKDKIPVVREEQNFICDGCYSSQSRIKKGNKTSEVLLNEAELFNTLSTTTVESNYLGSKFKEAWTHVLFNQFHDILTGSGVDETRDYALGLYQKVSAIAKTNKKTSLQKITEQINTADLIVVDDSIKQCVASGAGAGSNQYEVGGGKTRIIHVFNPALTNREEVVEVMLWDWKYDVSRLVIKDCEGNVLPHQIISQGFNHYWGHDYLNIIIKVTVPAGGYSTYIITEDDIKSIGVSYWKEMRVQHEDKFILENSLLRVELDSLDGSIKSIINKKNAEEIIDKNRKSGIFRLIDEADNKDITYGGVGMSSWFTGRYKNIDIINNKVEITKNLGVLRDSITYETKFRNSKIKVTVSLDEGSSNVNFNVVCNWNEVGELGKSIPQLNFHMPLSYDCDMYKYDVPFGVTDRAPEDMDLPGNSFVAAMNNKGNNSLMLISQGSYGFRCVDNSMSLTLLRGSFNPDPCPEYGVNKLQFSLNVINSSNNNKELINHSYNYRHPLTVASGTVHEGKLPVESKLVTLKEGSVVVSSVKMSEGSSNNKMIVRLYEVNGENTKVILGLPKEAKESYLVDINENRVDTESKVNVSGKEISFNINPYKIVTVAIEF